MINIKKLRHDITNTKKKYLSVPVSRIDNFFYWFYYIVLAHYGRSVFSPSKDTVYEKSFAKSGYDKYCEKINKKLVLHGKPKKGNVPIFELEELTPDVSDFLMRAQIPFVIRNGAQGLGILDWNLDLLNDIAGDCDVPINEAKNQPSADHTKPSKAGLYYSFRRGKLSEVIKIIKKGNSMASVSAAENVLYHADSRLREDIGIKRWENISGWNNLLAWGIKKKLWIGKIVTAQMLVQPGGAFTLWHMESGENFFVLSKGRKNWELVHPKYTAAMRPRVKMNTNYIGSNIDFRESDEIQAKRGFNGYVNIPKLSVDLEPGDVLRVPNYWWHTASTENHHHAIAATVRGISNANLISPGCMLLSYLDPQLKPLIKSLQTEGRIYDHHIGHPRKSRTKL